MEGCKWCLSPPILCMGFFYGNLQYFINFNLHLMDLCTCFSSYFICLHICTNVKYNFFFSYIHKTLIPITRDLYKLSHCESICMFFFIFLICFPSQTIENIVLNIPISAYSLFGVFFFISLVCWIHHNDTSQSRYFVRV